MAPPFMERRATITGMVGLGKTITVRPLSRTWRVIVSGPRALSVNSLTDAIVVFHSVRLNRLFFGGDEPADRAVFFGEVGAGHALHVFGGDGGQLVEDLVVHIGGVDAFEEAEKVCLAGDAVGRVDELGPRLAG